MNGTSRIGSRPIANAARHGSAAATTAATMIPMGTIAVVTNPTTRVRSRVGVNSSASGTAITATPATPAPTNRRSRAMYHQPPSGASASAPVASENSRMPAISGRRRPTRSPRRPHTMLPPIAPTPGSQQHRRRLAERQVPLVGEVGDHERDQEEVEQVQHGAHHHGAGEHVEAARQRRLVERLQEWGACGRQGSFGAGARRARAASASAAAPASATHAPTSSTQKPASGSASPVSISVVRPDGRDVGDVADQHDPQRDHGQGGGGPGRQALPRPARPAARRPRSRRRSPRGPRNAGRRRTGSTRPRSTSRPRA